MIKNIISDIGNVLFEFDTSGFIDKNIESEYKENFFNLVFASDNWRLLDKGDLSFEDGRNYFLSVFPKYKNILKKLLTNPALRDKIHHVPNGTYALVAQLDRVTDYESVGRGFESLPSHQKMP